MVVLANGKIRKLSTVVDELATQTAGALTAVYQELVAMRAMVMQNHLALDIILAKERGVCQVIRVCECCTYIPDNYQII